MTDLSAVRKRAWKTRRSRYGLSGHGGSYARFQPKECSHCARMQNLLIKLLSEEVLSEGQIAKATGLDRIEIRKRLDHL